MKKLICCIAVLTLVLCTACGSVSAYDMTSKAIAKTAALDEADITVEAKAKMTGEGLSLDLPVTYHIKAKGLQSKTPVAQMTLQTSLLGQAVEQQTYVENSWVYTTFEGESYKRHVDDMPDLLTVEDTAEIVAPLPQALLSDVKVDKTDDGCRAVVVTVDAATFESLFDDKLNALYGGTISFDGASVDESRVEITIDKRGYVQSYRMVFRLTVSNQVEGGNVALAYDMDVTVRYNNIGETVTVTPPAGYQNFPQSGA